MQKLVSELGLDANLCPLVYNCRDHRAHSDPMAMGTASGGARRTLMGLSSSSDQNRKYLSGLESEMGVIAGHHMMAPLVDALLKRQYYLVDSTHWDICEGKLSFGILLGEERLLLAFTFEENAIHSACNKLRLDVINIGATVESVGRFERALQSVALKHVNVPPVVAIRNILLHLMNKA